MATTAFNLTPDRRTYWLATKLVLWTGLLVWAITFIPIALLRGIFVGLKASWQIPIPKSGI
jgi:hypothetical protein